MPEPGWIDVAGGKLTTYRLMAEQTVDLVGRHLQTKLPNCRTGQEPLLEPAAAAFSGVLPPAVTREAVEHYCTHEWAVHLDDVMLRRSSWHYYDTDAASVAEQTAKWMGNLLGWDDSQREAELQAEVDASRAAGEKRWPRCGRFTIFASSWPMELGR